MQKNSKRVLTAVMTALFVLSISYFALLSPTTAWYYQDASQAYDFSFADFDVQQEANISDLNVMLRAATRFADVNEVLFGEVTRVVKINVTNNSGERAGVHTIVTQNNATPGLRWFVYDTAPENEILEYPDAAAVPGTAKSAYKTAIETMLTEAGVEPLTYTGEAAYEAANVSALQALDAHNQEGIVFEPGETKIVYVVLWAEYGEVVSALQSDTVQTLEYDLDVRCVAEPYHASKALITVHAPAALDIVYTEGTDAEAVSIHVDGTTQIEGTVGAHFRLTIVGSGYAFDTANTDGTVSAKNSKLLTGSVNSSGNTVTIVAAN